MKSLFLILLIIFTNPLLAQEKSIEIYKSGSDKMKTIKQNKRVKIRTKSGEKIIGRFQVLDKTTIEIKGKEIPIHSIQNIKRRSIIAGVGSTALIVYGGVFIATAAVVSHFGDSEGAALGIGSGVLIGSAGIILLSFTNNHPQPQWYYQIAEE